MSTKDNGYYAISDGEFKALLSQALIHTFEYSTYTKESRRLAIREIRESIELLLAKLGYVWNENSYRILNVKNIEQTEENKQA